MMRNDPMLPSELNLCEAHLCLIKPVRITLTPVYRIQLNFEQSFISPVENTTKYFTQY